MNWSQADVSARLYVAVCKNYARVLEMIWEKDNEASVARKAMGLYERVNISSDGLSHGIIVVLNYIIFALK